MKGIHFVWLAVGLGVLEAVSQSPTSAAAHFGGMAMAAFLVLFGFNRNKRRLVSDKVLTTLRLKKQPRLTVVPKGPDRWVN